MERAPQRRPERWLAAALVAATLVVYAPVWRHDFVRFDDPEYVTENPWVRRGVTADGVRWAFASAHSANWHPLTWLSHMLDCQLWGLRAGPHHATNVLLHAASSVILLGVLIDMTGAVWRSALVAFLFALHPLHVESVAWVAERKDVLAGLCWILTLAAYVRYARRPGFGTYTAVVASFVMGLLAKPMVVTLPFVLLLLDVWPLRRVADRSALRPLVVEKLPLVALAAAASVVTFIVQRGAGAMSSFESHPVSTRAANALVSYAAYLGKTAWPTGLAVFYPYREGVPPWQLGAAATVLALVSLVATRAPYLLVGWLWYLGTLVPVIGLVKVGEQAMADRFTYLPLVGVFVMVAWGVPEMLRAQDGRRLVAVGAAAVAACAVVSAVQLGYWRDSETLFRRALAVTHDNVLAHTNLGTVLATSGRIDEAIGHYEAALRIRPDDAKTHTNLGMALAAKGDRAAAIAEYRSALAVRPDYAVAHYDLGLALAETGRLDDAIAEYATAIRVDPDYAKAHANLGWALAEQGKLPEAVVQYREALRIDPDLAVTHNNLAVALERLDHGDEALVHYAEAARLVPEEPRTHYNLAAALAGRGRVDEAVAHYREGLRLGLEAPEVHDALGTLLAGQGKNAEAAAEYRRALALRPDWTAAQERLAGVLSGSAATGSP